MTNPARKPFATDRPLRWGILGTAEISLEVMRGIRADPGSELHAVASRNEAKAKAWASEHGIPLAFGSYEDLLNSGEVDLIYNPLPNALHATWTIKALEAGHPVLCEKPLAVDLPEAQAIAEASARTGLPVAEGFMYRHHPQWQHVAELLEAGVIGEVTSLHSQFTFLLDDLSANPASVEMAGGALRDVGCYCVHFSRMIAGCEPTWVSAFEQRDGVDMSMLGLLEFPGGVLAHFETSIASFERYRAEIAGTTGAITLVSPWIPGDSPATIIVTREEQDAQTIVVEPADSYQLEVEDFVAVCRDATSRRPVADAVANVAVLDALFASARERRAVQLI